MTNAIHYLEAAKVDQVAGELEAQGYKVIQNPDDYDLLATKNGKTIAIEVKARSALRQSSAQVQRLREQALQRGYDEFRLVIANPPREKTIDVAGLEHVLAKQLMEDVPEELYDVASQPYIQGVSEVEINSVSISDEGIRVIGTGLVDVELDWGGGEERDGVSLDMDFPFTFDIVLNSKLQIKEVDDISVDISGFYE